jgi:hypothetical protein
MRGCVFRFYFFESGRIIQCFVEVFHLFKGDSVCFVAIAVRNSIVPGGLR